MDITITKATPGLVFASNMAVGDMATMQREVGEPIVVVKNWAGLASLDGGYFWSNDTLEKSTIQVTPLSAGTTVRVTL